MRVAPSWKQTFTVQNYVKTHFLTVSTPETNSIIEQKLLMKNGIEDCQLFIVVGSILGCLLIASSLLMCILSVRLFKLTKRYKKERLEHVVREHRLKFGNQPASSNTRSSDLFSTSGNSNFLSPRLEPVT